MSNKAIVAKGLSKRYRIGERRAGYQTLRDTLARTLAAPARRFRSGRGGNANRTREGDQRELMWALRNISFEVDSGSVIGIIGRNGAGKSTLLKILSRITEPSRGYADMQGRVGSLLEVGTGFHPELSGRENIYLNGAILGMGRNEINRKFDEMLAFAEVEKFVDTPVKYYSSGMYLRLAFAVAAHLEPEILLVDEVLAVGDVAFQKKCLGKMGDVAREGRTVLFVSHNLSAIKELCGGGILLKSGELVFQGSASRCVAEYLKSLENESPSGLNGESRCAIGPLRVRDGGRISAGQPFQISVSLQVQELHNPWIFFIIEDTSGRMIVHSRVTSKEVGREVIDGSCELELQIPGLWLSPGAYSAYFKLLAPCLGHDSGRLLSERSLLEVDGEFECSGKAALSPRIDWRISAN